MVNSIQQFGSEGVKNLEKVMVDYASDMTRIAEMVQGVSKETVMNKIHSLNFPEWDHSRRRKPSGIFTLMRMKTMYRCSISIKKGYQETAYQYRHAEADLCI